MRPLLTYSTLQVGGLSLRCWSEPSSPTAAMQDAVHCSSPRPGVTRLAAIDGCTPMRQTPQIGGADGASYAAALTAAALQQRSAVPAVLNDVNKHLYRLAPELLAAARPSATAAVAEVTVIDERLHVEAWAAGDAQVWVRDARGWHMLVGGSSCAPEVKARWTSRRDAHRRAGTSFSDLQQLEAEFYNDPALFTNHTPLGRFEHLVLQHRTANVDEVVCATDGALLNIDALQDIQRWIESVRDVEARGVDRIKVTDDLAVVAATRQHKPRGG